MLQRRSATLIAITAALPLAVISTPAAAGSARVAAADTAATAALTDVAMAPGTSRAWALGTASDGSPEQSQVLTRRSGAWSLVDYSPPANVQLRAIAAGSTQAAWVVGSDGARTYIARSDGETFTRVALPHQRGILVDISASSSSNAWAVGEVDTATGFDPYVVHWDGSKWRRSTLSYPGEKHAELVGVSTTSAHNTYAISEGRSGARLLHWDGTAWSVAHKFAHRYRDLEAVAATGHHQVWVLSAYGTTATIPKIRSVTTRFKGSHLTNFTTTFGPSSPLPNDLAAVGHRAVIVGIKSGATPEDSGTPYAAVWNGSEFQSAPVVEGSFPSALQAVAINRHGAVGVGSSDLGYELDPGNDDPTHATQRYIASPDTSGVWQPTTTPDWF